MNIYLTTTNYIPRELIPNSKTGKPLNAGYSSYSGSAYFTDILDDYAGAADITNKQLQNLNKKYFDYIRENKIDGDTTNMKVVAYMMDTSENVWGKYCNEMFADYAIGGPTTEMLLDSYNNYAGTQKQYVVNNSYGYKFSWNNEENTTYYDWACYFFARDGKQNMYNIVNSVASGIWMASPGAAKDTVFVLQGGNQDFGKYSITIQTYGFRPIICLNSNVKLEKDGNNFKIVFP